MNTRLLRTARTATGILAALWLAACTTAPTPVAVDTTAIEQQAAAAVAAGDQRTAANLYLQLANTTSGAQSAGFLLAAAELEIALNNLLIARELLARAQPLSTEGQAATAQLLLAQIELAEARPADALTRTAPLLSSNDMEFRARVLELRGLAQFALGEPVAAIRSLSEREVWLNDIEQIRANQQTLWLNMFAVPPATPQTFEPIIDGWLALAPIARISAAQARRQALLEWRRAHLQHPAARVLITDLLGLSNENAAAPRQVALLLPISSGAREEARAIRDGFMAAHMSASDAGDIARDAAWNQLTVRVYDTGIEGALAAYQRAENERADFIVGPLFRNAVEAVLPQSGLIPTLTLNHTLDDEEVFGNTYQFALAPEDEAAAVAQRAIALEQRRAVVLIPDNARGRRIYESFRAQYEALGGEVLASMYYEGLIRTYSQRISSLLNLDLSESRERTLQANLSEDIEFAPRRRQDIDMIFLIANAADGRQLAPQLEYLYAGDIPTYAISDIHNLSARSRESDLNRIVFPQVPWLIAPDAQSLRLQQTISNRWPQRSLPLARFFAMGVDSYRIINTLYADPFFTAVNGSTGELRMDTQGRIHRALPFAQYRGGVVEPLENLPAVEVPAVEMLDNDPLTDPLRDTQPVADPQEQRAPIELGFPERSFGDQVGAGN